MLVLESIDVLTRPQGDLILSMMRQEHGCFFVEVDAMGGLCATVPSSEAPGDAKATYCQVAAAASVAGESSFVYRPKNATILKRRRFDEGLQELAPETSVTCTLHQLWGSDAWETAPLDSELSLIVWIHQGSEVRGVVRPW